MWGDDRALCDGHKARVSPRTRGFHTSQSEPVPEPVHPSLTCIKVLGVAHFRGAPASVTCFRGPLLKSSSELNAFWNMLPSGRTRALFPSPAHRPNALPPGALAPAVAGTSAARRVTATPARIPRPPSQPHAQACSLLRPVTSAGDARLPQATLAFPRRVESIHPPLGGAPSRACLACLGHRYRSSCTWGPLLSQVRVTGTQARPRQDNRSDDPAGEGAAHAPAGTKRTEGLQHAIQDGTGRNSGIAHFRGCPFNIFGL